MRSLLWLSAAGAPRWTPPAQTLEELVAFRGAIWPKLNLPDLPFGPRPGALDNIAIVDSLEIYGPADRARVIAAYRALGYIDTPMGPCVDLGYHGTLPGSDFRHNFGSYLDIAEEWERGGVRVNHFLRPDGGVDGLAWDVDDCERELTPLFSTPRAQALMRKVTLAWEPGGRYGYDNAWWVRMSQWMARVFPHALRSWHLPADQDAPVGQNDDQLGITNGQGWANVAPYGHAWLVQNGGYTDTDDPVPSLKFISDFTAQFSPRTHGSLPDRFRVGNPFGWPGFSAWGPDRGIVPVAGEYASFGLFWKNFPAEASRMLGEAAMAAGAIGFFDGGRVPA